jgi:hypothetical protein
VAAAAATGGAVVAARAAPHEQQGSSGALQVDVALFRPSRRMSSGHQKLLWMLVEKK